MTTRKTISLIAVIVAVVISLLLLVVRPITTDFLVGYGFALLGLAGLWLCTSMVLDRKGSYPWIAALPTAALTYLITETLASTVLVALARTGIWTLPTLWLFVVHAVMLAAFLMRVLMLLDGARHIDARGAAVKQDVQFIRSMQVEVEMMASRATDDGLKATLTNLGAKIRYSDPVSHVGLAVVEAKLEEKVLALKLAVANCAVDQTVALLRDAELLLEERNTKNKLLKHA